MAFVSPRMSLKVWNAASDPYDHEQLADNFLKLDQHDHSPGRGTPIGGEGIREGAITAVHIYPGTIGADAIGPSSINTDQVADGAVTNAKLGIDARWMPGDLKTTARPYTAGDPVGWLYCDGRPVPRNGATLALFNAIGTTYGVGDNSTTFNLPDMRGRAPVGADNMGTGAAGRLTASNRLLGQTGGTETHVLTTNELPSHAHGVTDPTHGHNINPDGAHSHTYTDIAPAGSTGGGAQSLSIRVNEATLTKTTSTDGQHSHGGGVVWGPTNISIQNTGSNVAHNNMQPYQVVNYLIKI